MQMLTDMQLAILSKAAAREDGAAVVPAKASKVAAARLATALLTRKLVREVRSKPGMPVWRKDDEGRSISLVMTRAGRGAISGDRAEDVTAKSNPAPMAASAAANKGPLDSQIQNSAAPSRNARNSIVATMGAKRPATSRTASKTAMVIEILSKGEGATIDALVSATQWLPHTTRTFLTGLRKRGFAIERQRSEGATTSTYRIVDDVRLAG